jgi:hypothetical protein
MDPDFSKASLLQFLSYISDKGLVHKTSSTAWRVAASKLLDDLSASEEKDVRLVDVDLAARKFSNRNPGKLSPESLNTYRNRLVLAIQEFVSWSNDPTRYRPRSASNGSAKRKLPNEKNSKLEKHQAYPEIPSKDITTGLSLPFPLRTDFLVQIVLPRDLTVEEAKRLGAFLLTLAVDYKPDQM